MAEPEHHVPPPNIRVWHYLPILIILGLAIHLLVPQIATLKSSWTVIRNMTWWAVIMAGIAQVLSYIGSGFMLKAIMQTEQEHFPVVRGVLITLASNSIGLVAGGWVGGAAATYHWVHQEDRRGDAAVLAGTLPSLLNNAILLGIALIGTLYLLVVHDLSRNQLIEFGFIVLVLILAALGLNTALRFPERSTQEIVRLVGWWAKLRHEPYEPQHTITSVHGFVLAWQTLWKGQWQRPVIGAACNVGFDMLTLYFLFIAAGQRVSLGVLFAGYGLPFILGKMAFIIPGGVGVIEGSMVAFYTSLHVPDAVSVVVILGYRLLSFWLPSLLGFTAAAYLSSDFSQNPRGR